jgi:hypothetical protein
MPRYYFNLRRELDDLEGNDFRDLRGALDDAYASARLLLADGVRRGEDRGDWAIVLRDDAGTEVAEVRLGAAVLDAPVTLLALTDRRSDRMVARPADGDHPAAAGAATGPPSCHRKRLQWCTFCVVLASSLVLATPAAARPWGPATTQG